MVVWGVRLFVAVNFSPDERSRILEVQERLRSQVLKGSFTRPENLHLTLAFLGETWDRGRSPEGKLPLLFRVMEEVRFSPFDITFSLTGFFRRGQTELWWLTAAEHPGLSLLKDVHGQLLKYLLKAGFPADTRPFKAHITLGREIKSSAPIVLSSPEIPVKVERISLMVSERVRGVLTYTAVRTPESVSQIH